jgi:hypothetical protein
MRAFRIWANTLTASFSRRHQQVRISLSMEGASGLVGVSMTSQAGGEEGLFVLMTKFPHILVDFSTDDDLTSVLFFAEVDARPVIRYLEILENS